MSNDPINNPFGEESGNGFQVDENMFAEDDSISQSPLDFTPKPELDPKKKKSKVWIAILAVAVIVIGAAAASPYFFVKTGDSKATSGDFAGAEKMYSLCFGLFDSDQRLAATKSVIISKGGDTDTGISEALKNGIEVHISYDLNGGHFMMSGKEKDVVLKDINDFGDFYKAAKENYDFGGWTITKVTYNPEVNPALINYSLKANFAPRVYKISYTGLYSDEVAKNPSEYTVETSTITLESPKREGYTFISWSGTDITDEVSTVVIPQGSTGNRAYMANWSANKYSVTFKPDVECQINTPIEVVYDLPFEFPQIEKKGYTYKGWSDGNNVYTNGNWKTTNDVVVTPVWELNTYFLKYDLAGGSVATPNRDTYTVLDEEITIINPTRHGYTFLGWTYEGQTSPNKDVKIPAHSIGDYNYKANWTGNKHTITLDLQGGSASQNAVAVVFGSDYSIPTPSKKGYSFDGWFDGSTQYSKGTWNQDNDLKVSAKWTANKYKVTFDSAGAGNVDSKTFTYDQNATLPTVSRTGYDFLGWYNGDKKFSTGTWKTDSDVKLKASWKAKQYTASLDAAGGSTSSNKVTLTFDGKYTLPTPTKKGHKFLGWYNGSTLCNTTGTWKQADNISLKAKWEANTYKIVLDGAGASLSKSNYDVVYGTNYSLPELTRTGYKFGGWYSQGKKYASSGKYDYDYNLTLGALWTPNTYKVSFNANGGSTTISGFTATYDKPYSFPTPAKKGHDFIGWVSGGTTYPTSGTWKYTNDLSLTASWEVKTYTITLYADGVNLNKSKYEVKYGSTYSLPTPSRTGYEFGGWYSQGKEYATSGRYDYDKDLTLGALWEPIQYTLTLDTNGGDPAKIKYPVYYDDDYALPIPDRKGYEFKGWYYAGYEFDSEGKWKYEYDMTVIAKWELKTYYVDLDPNGADNMSEKSYRIRYGDSYSFPTPSRDGYDFVGWYSGSKKYASSGTYSYDDDLMLVARWEPKKYTVTLNANGGSCSASRITVTYGERYTLPTPTKPGFIFEGWYYRGSRILNSSTWPYTSGITLDAKWSVDPDDVSFSIQ